MARRPLEKEQVYLDGGRRTTQLMRDPLGSVPRMPDHTREDLDHAAYDVADEFRDGKLPEVPGSWIKTRGSLLAELERRCPGFMKVEYGQALDDGFKWSR